MSDAHEEVVRETDGSRDLVVGGWWLGVVECVSGVQVAVWKEWGRGFGERTGCDASAMLSGALLLKPWMDWGLGRSPAPNSLSRLKGHGSPGMGMLTMYPSS